MWLRHFPKPYVAMGHQTRRKQRDREALALKGSFVSLGGRTGLIARP